jgi:hypothetical protein
MRASEPDYECDISMPSGESPVTTLTRAWQRPFRVADTAISSRQLTAARGEN